MTMTEPIFVMHNHHNASCGAPPQVNDEERAGRYYGYFENLFGEQIIFVYDRDTGTAHVYCGDAGWERPYAVHGGRAEGLILGSDELAWLAACWRAAGQASGKAG